MDTGLFVQLGVGLALFLGGIGTGLALRRRDAAARARVLELESELEGVRQELQGYRARVEKHFERTSHLFRDLTDHYSALYSHLADGARDLCPDGGPALGLGLNDPLLETGDLLAGDEGLAGDELLEEVREEAPEASGDQEPTRAAETPQGVSAEVAQQDEPESPAPPRVDTSRPVAWEDLVTDEPARPDAEDDEPTRRDS